MKRVGKYFVGFLIAFLFSSCCPKITKDLKKLDGPPLKINTLIWPSNADHLNFPEDGLNLTKTGICMSGGGTRAMVCAIGQLKALREIGVLDEVGYLSCVSGGSWASVPFTYYSTGAANDDELLGTIIPPKNLRLAEMDSFTTGFMGAAASCPLLDIMLENLGKYPADDVWIQGVSECYMQPFGLYDQNAPKYFSYDATTVADICQRNPNLSPNDFITVHNRPGDSKRPYLVVNSSISGPFKYAPFRNPEVLAVMNYTPLGIGSAAINTAVYRPEANKNSYYMPIGGGFIEPFAFGSAAPTILPSNCSHGSHGGLCVDTYTQATPYPIANASGTSSSAFAAKFTSSCICGRALSDLVPRMKYWPVSETSIPQSTDFMFGDGGNLENLGAITLLQRKVHNLVIFVNTDVPINTTYQVKDGLPTSSDVSDDILTLFGVPFDGSKDMMKNQVFNQEDIYDLMTDLIVAKKTGDSIIVRTKHVTIPNPWWGIKGGDPVNILWVYNDKVDDFIDALEPEIRNSIKHKNGKPYFEYFPAYATIDENSLRLVKLSPKQINLLYQFSAWHVYTYKEEFQSLLSGR